MLLDARTPAGLDAALAPAAACLRAGGLIGLPTETVYGLGGDAENPAAVAAIFAAKGRPADHPLIVHVADGVGDGEAGAQALAHFASFVPPFAKVLARAFWPGPLTLILPRREGVAQAAAGGQDSIGLRCPAHPVALALLRRLAQGPQPLWGIAAPSANRFGRVSPTSAAHVRSELGDSLLVLDGGDCQRGIESTIVACLNGEVRVLRPGLITPGALSRVAGVEVLVGAATDGPRVPGAVKAHYAPRTPLEVVPSALLAQRAAEVPGACVVARLAGVATGVAVELPVPDRWVGLPQMPAEFGQRLYATLRDLDALGAPRLFVEAPPAGEEWAAVRDRLARAAAAGELESGD